MNFVGSLGVAPGLIVFEREPVLSLDAARPTTREAVPKRPRQRRTRVESAALRERILAAVQRGDSRVAIALHEKVTPAFVDVVVRHAGAGGPKRRGHEELLAMARQLRRQLAAAPAVLISDLCRLHAITPQYYCNLMRRYP